MTFPYKILNNFKTTLYLPKESFAISFLCQCALNNMEIEQFIRQEVPHIKVEVPDLKLEVPMVKVENTHNKVEIPQIKVEIPYIEVDIDTTFIKTEPPDNMADDDMETIVIKEEPGVKIKEEPKDIDIKPLLSLVTTQEARKRKKKRPSQNRNRYRHPYFNRFGNVYEKLFRSTLAVHNAIADLNSDNIERSLKIGIWDRSYMRNNQLAILKRSLIMAIMENQDTSVPRIHSCVEQIGWLKIICKNQLSRKWFCKTVENLKPWPHANLLVRDCAENVNDWLVTITVDYSLIKYPNEIKTLLMKQNNNINVAEWQLTNIYYTDNSMKAEFSLNEDHIDELNKVDQNLFLGLGKANIDIKSNWTGFEE